MVIPTCSIRFLESRIAAQSDCTDGRFNGRKCYLPRGWISLWNGVKWQNAVGFRGLSCPFMYSGVRA